MSEQSFVNFTDFRCITLASGADFEVLDLAGVAQETDFVLVPKKRSPFKKHRGIKKKDFQAPEFEL